MAEPASLNEVVALAAKLPPREQLKLIASIGDQLSALLPDAYPEGSAEVPASSDVTVRADALLQELDAIADSIEGEFDSAQDLRRIREERASRL